MHADAAVHGDGLTSLQYRATEGRRDARGEGADDFSRTSSSSSARERRSSCAPRRGERPSWRPAGSRWTSPPRSSPASSSARTRSPLRRPPSSATSGSTCPRPRERTASHNPSPSRLELLDVDTGLRRIVYSSTAHFEAPNWSRDGRFLLFNQEGRIYRLPLDTLRPQVLDTGSVTANNNDHGISFDGKWLALSSHTEQAGTQARLADLRRGHRRRGAREGHRPGPLLLARVVARRRDGWSTAPSAKATTTSGPSGRRGERRPA